MTFQRGTSQELQCAVPFPTPPKPSQALSIHPWVSSVPHGLSPVRHFLTFPLELRILDLLETLHAALHLLRRHVVSPLSVLVDVQLVVLAVALVLALHDVLSQDLGDGLDVLDGIVLLLGSGLYISRCLVRLACE